MCRDLVAHGAADVLLSEAVVPRFGGLVAGCPHALAAAAVNAAAWVVASASAAAGAAPDVPDV